MYYFWITDIIVSHCMNRKNSKMVEKKGYKRKPKPIQTSKLMWFKQHRGPQLHSSQVPTAVQALSRSWKRWCLANPHPLTHGMKRTENRHAPPTHAAVNVRVHANLTAHRSYLKSSKTQIYAWKYSYSCNPRHTWSKDRWKLWWGESAGRRSR